LTPPIAGRDQLFSEHRLSPSALSRTVQKRILPNLGKEARIPMTGRSMDPKRASAQAQAIAKALGGLGEPITEAQVREIAVQQQCDCQEGMFALAPTRRGLVGRTGLIAAVGATAMLPPMARSTTAT
jgi:hypothetical protein